MGGLGWWTRENAVSHLVSPRLLLPFICCQRYLVENRFQTSGIRQDAMLFPPRNILVSGPTGSGKTYLVRTMAKMLGVPFVKACAVAANPVAVKGAQEKNTGLGVACDP